MINITDAEWKIMKLLWKKSFLTSKEIVEIMNKDFKWKNTTTYTLINRLVKKGVVGIKENSIPYMCYPIVTFNEAANCEYEHFIDKVYSNSILELIKNLVENKKIKMEEIDEIFKYLKNKTI